MERFKVFDILHHEHLCEISLTGVELNAFKSLFELLDEKGVKIKFLALHRDKDGALHLTFCVESSNLKAAQNILLQLSLPEENIQIFQEAGMVAVYGPHFGERPGIIDAMYNALSSQGVKARAFSTTASTSIFVVAASEVVRALDILKETFEIPHGKA